MSEVPFYVPTSRGPLAAIASLPDDEPPHGPAIAMLPSVSGERIRIDAYRDAARALAREGRAVLRFDYPGYGADPSPRRDHLGAEAVMGEAAEWFRTFTGLEQLALAGGCAGGLQTIRIAAANPAATLAVVQGERLRATVRKSTPVLGVGLAAIGFLPDSLRIRDDSGMKRAEGDGWAEPMLDALERAADHVRIVLVYGPGSAAYEDFEELVAGDLLAAEVRAAMTARVVGKGPLNTTRHLADVEALRRVLVEELLQPSRVGHG